MHSNQCQWDSSRGRCIPLPSLLVSLLLLSLGPESGRGVINFPLNFLQPPLISVQPQSLVVYGMEDISLACEASGIPAPEFRWVKDGTKFDPSNDRHLSVTRGSGNFSATSGEGSISEYHGNYSCLASNKLGTSVSNQVQLITEKIPIPKKETLVKMKAQEGESVILTCSPPHIAETPRIYWMGDGMRQIEQSARVTMGLDGNLYFSNVIMDDDRTDYSCQVQYRAALQILPLESIVLSVSRSNNLARNRKPQMVRPTGSHSTYLALRGRPFSLECIPQGLPTPSIQWVRKDGELSETRTSQQRFDRELQFSSVLESDAGEYQCLAKNSEGTVTHTYTVTVEAAPYWIKQPESQLYTLGDQVELTCEAEGIPTPTITWSMNGVLLSDVDPDPRRSVQGGTLILKDAKLSDSAVFQCEATNKHGTILINAYAYVLELPPQILTEDRQTYSVTEGQTALLECRTFGSPQPELKWDSEHLSIMSDPRVSQLNSGALQILDASQDDSGSFSCSVLDTELSITSLLEVLNRTIIVTPPQNLNAQRGHEAVLTCLAQVDAKLEPPQIQWRKNGQKLFASSTEERYTFGDHTLTVSNVHLEDAGQYTCEVITTLDKAEATGSITVVDLPDPPSLPDLLEKQDRSTLLSWIPGEDNNSPIIEFVVEFEEQRFGAGKWEEAKRVPGDVEEAEVPLLPNRTYRFRVISVNKVGRSQPSEVSEAHDTPPAAPERNPEGVRSDFTEPDQLVITWEEMEKKDFFGPEFQYKVMWRKAGGHHDSVWERRMVNAPPVTVPKAGTFTAYEMKVQAVNQIGEGPVPSPVIGHSGEDIPLEPPIGVGVVMLNSTTVRVTWSPVNLETVRGHFHGYRVHLYKMHQERERREEPGGVLVLQTKANEETKLLGGLQPFTAYTVSVTVVNGKGEGPESDPLFFRTMEGVPSKPKFLRLDSPSETEMTLHWAPPAQVNGVLIGYVLEYHEIGEGEDKEPHVKIIEDRNASHTTVRNLDPHSLYLFSLKGSTSAGKGEAIVREGATRIKRVPLVNINTSVGEKSVNVSWENKAPKRSVGFHILHRKVNNEKWIESEELATTQLAYELQNLEPGSDYLIRFVFRNSTFNETKIKTKGEKNGGAGRLTGNFAKEGWFIGVISALLLLLLILLILCAVKRSKGGKYSVKDKEAGQIDSEARPMRDDTFGEYSDIEEKQTASQTSLCATSKVGSEGNLMQYAHGVGVDSQGDAYSADQYSDPGAGLGTESQDGLRSSSPATSVSAPAISPARPSSGVLA
ncbi:hypothetical protein GJAV_G00185720 [Gymnothorax javanicus]|nr:hypothetical protein GJAV_G00185720 [Gymnothorax javanicus]